MDQINDPQNTVLYTFLVCNLSRDVADNRDPLDCRLRQTANLKKFFCNEIKIMNREIFEQYDLL